jgi:hypothetical protein
LNSCFEVVISHNLQDAVVVNQCPCTIAACLYASFLDKGVAAFLQGAKRH